MSHVEQIKYVETVISLLNEEKLRKSKVLEIGSYDVDGSIRLINGRVPGALRRTTGSAGMTDHCLL